MKFFPFLVIILVSNISQLIVEFRIQMRMLNSLYEYISFWDFYMANARLIN